MFSVDMIPLSEIVGGGTGGQTSPPKKGGKDAPLEVGATSFLMMMNPHLTLDCGTKMAALQRSA